MKYYRSSNQNLIKLAVVGGLVGFSLSGYALADAPVIDLSKRSPSIAAGTLDERVSKLERVLENRTLIDMNQRLEALQEQTTQLLGQMEEARHTLDELQRRQRELYLDVDRRLQALESGAAKARAPETGSASPAPEGSSEARGAYQGALNILRKGKYEEATKKFRTFLSKYPNSEYADNAQYWLADANYIQKNYDVALKEFEKLLANFPKSKRSRDALLKTGLIQHELGNSTKAQLILNNVKANYPNTPEAQIAEKRLQQIKLQSRQ